jgi:hypothetical protein
MDKNNQVNLDRFSTKNLKTIAAFCIYESNLEVHEKLSLLNFIEHAANRKQITNLVIIEGNLLVTSIIIASALAAGNKAYYKVYAGSTQACREEENKKECLKQYKVKALSEKRNEVRKHVGRCSQTVNPEQCNKTFSNTIKKIEQQIINTRVM